MDDSFEEKTGIKAEREVLSDCTTSDSEEYVFQLKIWAHPVDLVDKAVVQCKAERRFPLHIDYFSSFGVVSIRNSTSDSTNLLSEESSE